MGTDKALIGKQLVALKNHIVAGFTESHWQELGTLTGHSDLINGHHRLLRSMRFGDDDYEGHVLSVLQAMVDADLENLAVITEFVQAKCPEAGEYISSEASDARRIVFSPNVFHVPDGGVDYNLVSAMVPFSLEFSPAYQAIQSACAHEGFACKRADDIWDDSTIVQDIFSLIFASYIVVCDFSGKNPNVFYEAGIAHALGKHVVPITQSADDIPFDLRHHRFIPYLNNAQGRQDLEEQLRKRLATLAARRKALPWA
jgi:hypothetical protein